jgi:5-methyltetrahydrofolate--homocysteine methyltransferase
MLLIGESINGTIQKVGQAILNRDAQFLRELARVQFECGAQMLDVNAGVAGGNEMEDLPWVVKVVQKEVSLPLMLDSANPEALKAALKVYQNTEPPILNSISGEESKWDQLFPAVVEKKHKVVVLLMDDRGIPKTLEERLDIAKRLFRKLTEAGLPPNHIYFDILVLSVAVEPDAGLVTLETIKAMRAHFPESHIICGISNISMGLPGRRLINRIFLAMAISAGVDTLLVNVRDRLLMSSIFAANALLNQDPYCLEYLKAYRENKIVI